MLRSDVPTCPQCLRVDEVFSNHCRLSWKPPQDDGGSEIMGICCLFALDNTELLIIDGLFWDSVSDNLLWIDWSCENIVDICPVHPTVDRHITDKASGSPIFNTPRKKWTHSKHCYRNLYGDVDKLWNRPIWFNLQNIFLLGLSTLLSDRNNSIILWVVKKK